MNNQRLGHILKEAGLINDEALEFGLSVQRNNGHERLGKVLIDYDFISEEHIVTALSKQSGWPVYRGDYEVSNQMVQVLGIDFCHKHMIFPAKKEQGDVIIMAFCDDMTVTDQIQSKLDSKVHFMLAPESHLRKAMSKISDGIFEKAPDHSHQDDLIAWLDVCLKAAISKGATDIHIEPSVKAIEVRFRLDGILYFYQALRHEALKRLVNIVFHKADVTISDFGKFHDARFSFDVDNLHVDVRVSHVPAINGSSLVLRLLDKKRSSIALTDLGFTGQLWEKISTMLVKPEGMVLVIGPTGCGKTTTLYAMLNAIKSIERKIVTIEDPVEMHHTLLTQVQANLQREISFSNSVRAFLRHDPNIILIGEIRDALTAQEAIRASMTGHKVFATLHANQGMDAFLRLRDLGVPYAYMATNITMIITQRLVRILCPHCSYVNDGNQGLPKHMLKYVEGIEVYKHPKGCSKCNGGYKGRRVVASVLECDETICSLLLDENIVALKEYIIAMGVTASMGTQVREMIKEGKTSPMEAVRVLG